MSTSATRTQLSASTTTLTDVVYQRLREDVVLGRLRPNSLLLEAELAERLDVSRTPVRESLQRLAKEGLIASRSRRWYVVEPTLNEIREMYGVRAALEGYAARMAASRATPEQLEAISAALDLRGHAGPSAEEFVTSNEKFHRLILDASGNQRLVSTAERSTHFYFNSSVARLYRPEELATSHRQHEEIVKAIRAGDGDTVDRITRDHIAGAFALIENRWNT
jgi:DNA-binding GntR family transcriptional regulator